MTNPTAGIADELERLAALHKSGVLTDEEFKVQKAKVLNPQPVALAPTAQPSASSGGAGKWWVLIVLAGVGGYFYLDSEYPEFFLSGLPRCDSRKARKMVERTVEENSVGLAQGRRIVEWLGDSSSGNSTLSLVECRARVSLNMGGDTGMAYSFEKRGDQTMISVEFD